jgi:hypothetical protein
MLDSARRKTPVPALARRLLGLGIAATLAANVAHGLGHGAIGAAVAVAGGRARRLLRTPHDDGHPKFSGRISMTRLTAGPLRIPCGSKRLRCSPSSSRRTGFPQFVPSALSSTSASPERGGCEILLLSVTNSPAQTGISCAKR